MDNQICKLLIKIIQDLENTREIIHGYSYVRTIRNILIGKEDALIAPNFKNKEYYGLVNELTLQETEKILDYLVDTNQITYFFTQNGKLYCTFDYYKTINRKDNFSIYD